jgi:DNA (cytosine-5)-methyltransferase 1
MLRPRFVVVENVAALLGRGLGRVLRDLAEIGYDAEWEIISAADVGAPHLRERVWIVAYPSQRSEQQSIAQSAFGKVPICDEGRDGEVADAARVLEGRQEQRPQRERIGQGGESDVADADRLAPIRAAIARGECGEWEPESGFCRVAHGVPAGVDGGLDAWRAGEWEGVPRVARNVPERVNRLKALGNSIVPQIAELIARRIANVS